MTLNPNLFVNFMSYHIPLLYPHTLNNSGIRSHSNSYRSSNNSSTGGGNGGSGGNSGHSSSSEGVTVVAIIIVVGPAGLPW